VWVAAGGLVQLGCALRPQCGWTVREFGSSWRRAFSKAPPEPLPRSFKSPACAAAVTTAPTPAPTPSRSCSLRAERQHRPSQLVYLLQCHKERRGGAQSFTSVRQGSGAGTATHEAGGTPLGSSYFLGPPWLRPRAPEGAEGAAQQRR
jgi:hypothetical protein